MGAEAALCIESQNPDSFWTFLDKIIQTNEKPDSLEESINIAAKESGVDYDKFRSCFLQREFEEKVNNHLLYAKKMGVTAAPLLILQGTVLDNINTQNINDQLKSLGIKSSGASGGFFAKLKSFFGF